MTLDEAIERSAERNEIVTFDFEREVAEDLITCSDDHVINGDVMEFWSDDDADGGNWRVHLRLRCPADVRAAAEVSLGI